LTPIARAAIPDIRDSGPILRLFRPKLDASKYRVSFRDDLA
jgi:hypothetical protein